MSRHLQFTPNVNEVHQRLDAVIAARSEELSRTSVRGLILAGKVLVNGSQVKPAYHLSAGDRVDAQLDLPPSLTADPEDLPLNLVYVDRDVAVIDKHAGMVVHPAGGHRSGTLANALTARFPGTREVGAIERPGIVHRLDKDTSGLLVVALTAPAQASLQKQIAARTARRVYLALCVGHLRPSSGVLDAPVGRDPINRRRMAVYGVAARPARTSYRVLEDLDGYALVEATLHTGRTHQIRVHFAASGHPLAGDVTYGGPRLPGLDRQFLHAHMLSFDSPGSGERLSFQSPLPDDLDIVLQALRGSSPSLGIEHKYT